jgi:hypothetical protein
MKRATKKTITQKLMLDLIDVAEGKRRNKEHIQAYWNTWHCQNILFTSEGRVYADYCKNRFCPVCCGIRKARLINQYLPVLKEWEDAHFLTLTLKSIPASQLEKEWRR